MSKMKKLIYTIILLTPFAFPMNGSAAIEFIFSEGNIQVSSIRKLDRVTLTDFQHASDPLYTLFYRYYYPSSLQNYKSLFYEDGYPVGIDNNFNVWRKNMAGVSIRIHSVINAFYNGKTTAIINFEFNKSGNTLRLSFFAKQIQGRWYPYEAEELAGMNDLRYFFPIINEDVMEGLLKGASAGPAGQIALELSTTCSVGKGRFSAMCIYAKAEDWGISNDPEKQELASRLFIRRISGDSSPAINVSESQISSLFQEANIPLRESRIIAYYLEKGETMIAYHRIQNYASELQFSEINTRLEPVLESRALNISTRIFEEENK